MKYSYLSLIVAAFLTSTAKAEEVDYTTQIVNNGFESGDLSGWTNNGFQSQTNNSPADQGWEKEGTVYAEKWTSSPGPLTDASIYQVVTDLPNGDYLLRAVGHSVNQSGTPSETSGTYLYTTTGETLVTVGGEYEVSGTVAEGTLTIGFKAVSTDANWVAIDNFRIYYVGESLEGYKKYLDILLEELTTLFNESQKPPTYNDEEISAALGQASAATTQEEILAAIASLRSAESNYRAIKSEYREAEFAVSRMKSEINIAEMFYADSDYAGKDTFRAAIDSAKAVYADPNNSQPEYDVAIAALKAASKSYMANRPEEWVRIKNGAMWKDDSGNAVQAHGAGFLLVNDRYYMIGEDRSNSWNPDVNMYSSKDLVNWRYEGKIIENGVTHPDLGKTRMIERPKLAYNAKSGKFVVWCHWESSNYSASEAGVFYSESVTGEYQYHSGERPLGIKSRDCNLYIDDDGTGYFISTTSENTNLGLFKLSDDYLDPEEHTVLFSGQKREAPAIVKHNGRYYMLSSACSGWDPNPCKLSYTDDLTSGWSSLKQVGNPIAYDTQAASILKVEGSKATTYLYVGDRWKDPDLPESKTIIFPISFEEKSCNFEYLPEFEINFVTGEWRKVESDSRKLDKAGWSILDCSSEETVKEDGSAVNILDGDLTTKWHTQYSGEAGVAPHYVSVDMGEPKKITGFLAVPRTDTGSYNGLIRDFDFRVSSDGETWQTVSAGEWMPYWTEVYFAPIEARYFRLEALSGSYASLAEIEILQDTAAYEAATLKPAYKTTGSGWVYDSEVSVVENQTLTFGTYVENNHGSWALETPSGTILAGREVALESISREQQGGYRAWFVDMYNTTHSLDYTVNVAEDTAVEEFSAERGVSVTGYYDLNGVRLREPQRGINIVVMSDGSVRKEFRR